MAFNGLFREGQGTTWSNCKPAKDGTDIEQENSKNIIIIIIILDLDTNIRLSLRKNSLLGRNLERSPTMGDTHPTLAYWRSEGKAGEHVNY